LSAVSVGQAGQVCATELTRTPFNVPPSIRGKFVFTGPDKFLIKGVTYGAFRPNSAGAEFHDVNKIRRDFQMIARSGMNTVRVQHTMPGLDVLDMAAECKLRVMGGLSAEQYIGHLLDGRSLQAIFAEVRNRVRIVKGHPALLCYAIGNEIPAAVVRWLGRERTERYIREFYDLVKDVDPDGVVTYVNYPSTEYLQLQFLDICSFNVYLEQKLQFEAYLARLQNIAMDRPLVITELGVDSRGKGVAGQAEMLDWQVRSSFAAGCAGAVVFSWTDEWYRAGDVKDWEFGLTDCQRKPRPALAAVSRAFQETPFPRRANNPLISVVVCTFNGSRTIDECLLHLTRLNYPNYEVIVVDDGSTDNTPKIVRRYPVRSIRTENRGLSAARNTGCELARGEIVVYIDDDAYPDPDWLDYYHDAFERSSHAMIGGPNLVPLDDPAVAQCVGRAPGGPAHVLLTDTLAEHVPGCNMGFRKSCLQAVGGFDPVFRVAGDDVDVCWRIQEKGWTIGFAPSAVVWHHRRPSIKAYWKQQRGYGKAEALLHEKWPERFNSSNHLPWAGTIYGPGLLAVRRPVIYHGVWGSAPFQTLHASPPAIWEHLLEVPEMYMLNGALALLSALGILWRPMLLFLPLLCVGAGYPLMRAILKASHARFPGYSRSKQRLLRGLTAVLHVAQPLARLWGRVQHGLTPWKRRGKIDAVLPYRREWAVWSEDWVQPSDRLLQFERGIHTKGFLVHRGGAYEVCDLDITGGLLGGTRVLMAVEDHGAGCQYVRTAAWPRYSPTAVALMFGLAAMSGAALLNHRPIVGAVLAVACLSLLGCALAQAGRSLAAVIRVSQEEQTATLEVTHTTVRDSLSGKALFPPMNSAAMRRSEPDV